MILHFEKVTHFTLMKTNHLPDKLDAVNEKQKPAIEFRINW